MKTKIITATLLLTVTMFIASCGSKTSNNTEKEETEPTEQVENVKYQCPMKCEGEKTYDKPGQCPKCNMDLKQVEENLEHSDHNH